MKRIRKIFSSLCKRLGVITTPNKITIFRGAATIITIPLWPHATHLGQICLLSFWFICWLLDGVDGEVARISRQITKVGIWLDPFVDKLQFYIPMFSLFHAYTLYPTITLAVLDIISMIHRKISKKPVPANSCGKCKMLFQIMAFFAICLWEIFNNHSWLVISNAFLIIAIILSIISLSMKFRRARL